MVRFGVRNGIQRYRCRVCKTTRSDSPENPLGDLRVPIEKAVQVVNLLCESTGIRACERLTGLNRRTVLSILKMAGLKAARYTNGKVRNVKAEVVQADEIHTIVECRQQNAFPHETRKGAQFMFISMDRNSKLIINTLVGKRTSENAHRFMGCLKRRVTGRFQLVTDNWKSYSGRDGGAVSSTFGENVDYATETKVFGKYEDYLPRTVIAIRRKPRIGDPDMEEATTCHVERTNLSVRTFTRRFTRCTLGYSKKLENLRFAVWLFVWHFNFCRKHSAHGQTPAMAAGLTDKPMTIMDLLSI
jgi:IS1 family transposase